MIVTGMGTSIAFRNHLLCRYEAVSPTPVTQGPTHIHWDKYTSVKLVQTRSKYANLSCLSLFLEGSGFLVSHAASWPCVPALFPAARARWFLLLLLYFFLLIIRGNIIRLLWEAVFAWLTWAMAPWGGSASWAPCHPSQGLRHLQGAHDASSSALWGLVCADLVRSW